MAFALDKQLYYSVDQLKKTMAVHKSIARWGGVERKNEVETTL